MMERVMFQADRWLLERVRQAARERRVSFAEFVRSALEHELGAPVEVPPPVSCAGIISTKGQARHREYEPDAWR